MKRRRKIVFAIVIALCVILSLVIVWFSEASINYWFNTDFRYEKEDGNWFTVDWTSGNRTNGLLVSIECYNAGQMTGTFDILVEFEGATISPQTPLPYSLQDNSTAKFPLTLPRNTHQTIDVYFSVDENTTKNFSLTLNCLNGQLWMHSTEANWGGQNTFLFALSDTKNEIYPPPLIA